MAGKKKVERRGGALVVEQARERVGVNGERVIHAAQKAREGVIAAGGDAQAGVIGVGQRLQTRCAIFCKEGQQHARHKNSHQRAKNDAFGFELGKKFIAEGEANEHGQREIAQRDQPGRVKLHHKTGQAEANEQAAENGFEQTGFLAGGEKVVARQQTERGKKSGVGRPE